MRLVSEALSVPEDTWPEAIKNVQLSEEDAHLGRDGKLIRAGNMVCDVIMKPCGHGSIQMYHGV